MTEKRGIIMYEQRKLSAMINGYKKLNEMKVMVALHLDTLNPYKKYKLLMGN